MKFWGYVLLIAVALCSPAPHQARAQGQLAATMEVLTPGVEVLRFNTVNWVAVNIEAIVGVGDRIRTDATGSARVTFFADGVDTEIRPETEYIIQRFEGDDTTFNLSVEVVVGETIQRIERVLDSESSYDVSTPGMELAARGTAFDIRVENGGRSAMLVTIGTVNAAAEDADAPVEAGFGVRSAVGASLSDVVRATTFDQLDAALDGCAAEVGFSGDIRLNVRLGPGLDFPRIATIDPAEIDRFFGVNETGNWWRLAFRDHFAWVFSDNVTIEETCAGLRQFADDFGPEDPTLFSSLGEPIELDDVLDPAARPAPTEAVTPEAAAESTTEPES